MPARLLIRAAALCLLLPALPAAADDPGDPAMANAAARARDKAEIRRLNLEQLAKVRARDAGYAEGWRAYRDARSQEADPTPTGNAARQADYERRMAEWHRAVALCEAGHREYCARN